MLAFVACLSPWVIDGDSIRCANLGEVRLLGIDSPDYTFSRPCRERIGDHVCDDRGAKVAKGVLIRLKQSSRAPWRVEPVTRDRYGRTVGQVWAATRRVGRDGRVHETLTNLSCWQLEHGVARYIVAYDNGGRIARACGRR
jgi:micrococcal nuclease